jgi:tetratricopeptide (TPR) repeat protein
MASEKMVNSVEPNPAIANPAIADYQTGKAAFARGQYRQSVTHLQRANALANPNSPLGGEIQIWLVTAYEAAGQHDDALSLCRALTRHPHYKTRKEGQRLLYILEAPKLQTRPEWLTQIPDLTNLSEGGPNHRIGTLSDLPMAKSSALKPKPPFELSEPVDLSQVNTEDGRFVWVALIITLLVLGGLLWLA